MRANELIAQLQDWALQVGTKRTNRPWCLFGLVAPINQKEVAKLFDRSEVGKEYKARYAETMPSKKKPHSFLQLEAHLIYSAHKAFIARHKTRLQYYRDDAAQKAYHIRRAVTKSFSRFSALQAKAEAEAIDV